MMLLLFVALLVLTAFFNLAEMALVAARVSVLGKAENAQAAEKVLTLKKRPGLFLAAIRAGDLVTDLVMGAFIVTWFEHLIRSAITELPVVRPYAPVIANIGAFVVVSYVMLVFADLAPKSVALSAPERSALLIASPLRLFILVARPLFASLEASNSFVLRLIGVKPQSEERVTQEEIRRTLSEGLSAGVLLSFERSMMERVLDLDQRSVRTVMTGRRYIQSLRADSDRETLKSAVFETVASRLLVTRNNDLDELLGTVSRADVLAALARDEEVDLGAMALAPSYVSETASVLSVLETLKNSHGHLVVVVDEFGSLLGVATFADVLEAVAGEVAGADGAPGVPNGGPLKREADGSYLMSGSQPVDDITEALPLSAPVTRGYKTMAGYVIEHLKRLPREGEVIALPALHIEIVSIERGMVKTLRLTPKQD